MPMGDRKLLSSRTQAADASSREGFKGRSVRYSKQPAVCALRSNSNSAKEKPNRWMSERVYESTKLAPYSTYSSTRAHAGEILRNVTDRGRGHSPKSRIRSRN